MQMAQVVADFAPPVPWRILNRPYSLLGLTLLLALTVPSFQREPHDWEMVYIPAGERLQRGEDIFGNDYVYPPINAWLAIPFVGLPNPPARMLWYAVNMTALAVLLLGAWKLSGGCWLEGSTRVPWREHSIFWLGLVCGFASCFDVITNQQTDLIVAALVILGCGALVRGCNLRAALWFGAAAAIKCTPLLWAGYLAWRRRWSAALLVVVVAVAVNLLPDLTHPLATGGTRFAEWTRRFLLPMTERNHDFGAWHCGIGGNQSVAGLWHRWLLFDTAWEGNNLVGVPRPTRIAPETLKAVTWGSMLLLLGAGLASSWRSAERAETNRPPALELGMVLILMVLLSPHSSKPHFCTLLLPGFCVARAALHWPNRRLLAVLIAALILSLISNQDLVGEWLYSWTKWYGSLAGCALLLYAASCRALLNPPPAPNPRAAP
jgi:Glycosyltransferase family 87